MSRAATAGRTRIGPRRDTGAAPLIELVFGRLESAFAIEIIRGVQRAAQGGGMGVVLTEAGDERTPGADWVEQVLRRNPAGVVLVFSDLSPEQRERLRLRGIPFVVLDPAGDPAPDVASIGAANWTGGLLAARHLLALGHRRIGVVAGPADMMCSQARLGGFRAALEEAGVPVREGLIRVGRFRREDGIRLGLELLATDAPPTAIIAGNDLTALGVYEAARRSGLRVPDELSVVGYDDLQLAQWAGPPLTTVRQPLAEMGARAARLALALRAGEDVETRIELATSLVVRESTAAPRAA